MSQISIAEESPKAIRRKAGTPKEIKVINNKPVYRQSEIVNFFDCPKKFSLSRQFDQKSSAAMDEGLLIEGLVFGFKDESEKNRIIGRKRESTLESYSQIVNAIKPHFVEGQAYVKIRYEGPHWILEGEIDYLGLLKTLKGVLRGIGDLKFTKRIDRIWDSKSRKQDFIQAAFYPFIIWKTTGEILPFVYFLFENEKDMPLDAAPISRQIFFMPDAQVFEWVESLINTVHNTIFFDANPNACSGGQFLNVRCPYLHFCSEGRRTIESGYEINFNLLED